MSPPGGRAKGRILIGLALAIFAVALALAARPHDETNAERIDRITSELAAGLALVAGRFGGAPPAPDTAAPTAGAIAMLRDRVAREESADT